MARRKKSSPAEDLIDVVSMLPWWLGVAMALGFYFFLHGIATSPAPIPVKTADVASAMTGAVWRGFANFGQVILPLLCLAGAAVSAWRKRQRKALVNNVVSSDAVDSLDGMSWREFETLVGEGFRLQGFSVTENSNAGPDGGVDLVLRKGGEKYLVQCKQWRAFKVGVPVVRELYGVMAAKGAAGGFVVTSGRFTDEAKEFASGRNVKLLDGPMLHRLLRQARTTGGASAPEPIKPHPRPQSTTQSPRTESSTSQVPSCPRCAKSMVRRTAKKGANAGADFWGCSDYPRCRGTAS